jgi:CDGSH-type Zn-finger protein
MVFTAGISPLAARPLCRGRMIQKTAFTVASAERSPKTIELTPAPTSIAKFRISVIESPSLGLFRSILIVSSVATTLCAFVLASAGENLLFNCARTRCPEELHASYEESTSAFGDNYERCTAEEIFFMSEPTIAQKGPFPFSVEAGKSYFWCACGLSASQPLCDGSHKRTDLTPVRFDATETTTVYFCGCKHTKSPVICDGTHQRL